MHHPNISLADYPIDSLTPQSTAMLSTPNQSQRVLAPSTLPRKFDTYNDPSQHLDIQPNGIHLKDIGPPGQYVDMAHHQNNTPSASPFNRNMGQLSPIAPLDYRRDLVSSRGYYPIGLSPTATYSAGNNAFRGLSTVNMIPGYRDSISGFVGGPEPYSKIRGDSISLPPPFGKTSDGDIANLSNSSKSASWGHEPLRSTSIFSSLVQLPPSTHNSVSGQSSKENSRLPTQIDGKRPLVAFVDYDMGPKDHFGSSFNWRPDYKPSMSSFLGSRRGTKAFESSLAVWDQINRGMGGSVASINSDNLNNFLATMQNTGSVDLLHIRNDQRNDSIMKYILDQSMRPLVSSQPRTSLREDIFDDKRSVRSTKQSRNASVLGDKPLSPTSSLSSKTSRRNYDEPQSPRAAQKASMPLNHVYPYPLDQFNKQSQLSPNYAPPPHAPNGATSIRDTVSNNSNVPISVKKETVDPSLKQNNFYPPQHTNSQGLHNVGSPNFTQLFKSTDVSTHPHALAPNLVDNNTNQVDDKSQLVPAQQYARAEDGRPLLGATKVDQLMLVIQAREKGNTAPIKQGPDGSVLAPAVQGQNHDSVLPLPVDLVGGIEKPVKEEPGLGEGDRKRRKGKLQECPYCLKTFNQSTHLDVHVRSHIGYKPYQCTVCLKRFTQGGNLRTHMRLHTGEKPFSCSVCDRSFSRKGNLAAHMLTHNKEKPFHCKLDNCDKSFTQLGNLKSHQNKFHLPTLTLMTHKFANLTGDAIGRLPKEEQELLEYFAKLYKNSNKGIRGRGKGTGVLKINEGGAETLPSMAGSTQGSPAGYNQSFNHELGSSYGDP